MTSEQQWNKAQRPIDFEAPEPVVWSPLDRSGFLEIDDLTKLVYLARNTVYITKATRKVVLNLHRPLFFEEKGSSVLPPGTKLQCGIRLKRLLQYHLYVCQVCLKIAKLVYCDPQSKAATQVMLLDHYARFMEVEMERLPRSWTVDLPAPQNDKYRPFHMHKRPHIPTEPMLELYMQLCIWIETRRPEADVQNLRSEDGVQLFLRSTMSMWPRDIDILRNDSKMGMSKCLFAAQSTKASTFATANLVIGCTGARLPKKVGHYFDQARLLRFRGDSTDSSPRFDLELMAKWQPSPPDPMNDRPPNHVATAINNDFMNAVRMKASLRLYQDVTAYLGRDLNPKGPAPDADNKTWNSLTITQATRYMLRDGDPTTPPHPSVPAVPIWSPFVWKNMTARSHFVMPGTVAGEPEWFTPMPRCSKCRTIHEYTISTEQDHGMLAMLNYNEVNRPLGCAEDIIHCKLRMLNPDDNAGAGIAPFAMPLRGENNVGPNLSWYSGRFPVQNKEIMDNGTWAKDAGKVTWDEASRTYDVQFPDGTTMSQHQSTGLLKTAAQGSDEIFKRNQSDSEKKRQQAKAMKKEQEQKEKEGSDDHDMGSLSGE